MNKALHAFVYLILAAAAVAAFFEMKLFDKRTLLIERDRAYEDFVVKIAHTIEKEDAKKPATTPECKKDVSPVEAKIVDNPELQDLLEGYAAQREQQNLDTFKWDSNERIQLRKLYLEGPDGKPVPDAANYNKPMTKGKGTRAELLDQLFDRAKAQQGNLNITRAALVEERQKLETLVAEFNKLKNELRQEKVTVEELKAKAAKTEQEKTAVEEQVAKQKTQIEELTAETTSLKDEVASAKDATDAAKEEVGEKEKQIEKLNKILLEKAQTATAATSSATGTATGTLKAGVKGKIADVNNELMFCVVEFTEEGIEELLGKARNNPLPLHELGVRRGGKTGDSGMTVGGSFVGRIRLRQAIADKNYVIADILGDWQQGPIEKGDGVYAE